MVIGDMDIGIAAPDTTTLPSCLSELSPFPFKLWGHNVPINGAAGGTTVPGEFINS